MAEGELVAVIGPVGSGKSSLLRAFLGELPGDLMAPPKHVAPWKKWITDNISLGKWWGVVDWGHEKIKNLLEIVAGIRFSVDFVSRPIAHSSLGYLKAEASWKLWQESGWMAM